ncbi:PIN domain-containing protein [bacterium]|nr:PIN domain-containing protein [bacterium]
MKLLIDGHALLWHRDQNPSLSPTATFWELSIKISLKKLTLLGGLESLREEWIDQEIAKPLPISWPHIRRTIDLPFHHRDPFDRILVAQCLAEKMTLLTGDPQLHKYSAIKTLW